MTPNPPLGSSRAFPNRPAMLPRDRDSPPIEVGRRRWGRSVETPPLAVLKFGSSVLSGPDDYRDAARVVAAEVTRGRRVVAVVSAMGRTTDTLLAAARAVTATPPEAQVGALLATGEETSVALLTLALVARGVRAAGISTVRGPVLTRGALHDADPIHVDTKRIRRALQTHDALVFPGFVGVDSSGARSLLGRGGSDLTALFLGDALGATEIRLIKDVDGIFPEDPRGGNRLAPYATLTWDSARQVGGGVVQPKAIDYAERRRLRFRVVGPGGAGTRVGLPAAAAEPAPCRQTPGYAAAGAAAG